MSNTTRAMRRHRRHNHSTVFTLMAGLGVSILVTLAGVALFALLMQLIRPADGVIRIFNQVLKLVAIGAGVAFTVRRTGGGPLQGALIGLIYMLLGVGVYAMLTGLGLSAATLLADLGMGLASGGMIALLLGRGR